MPRLQPGGAGRIMVAPIFEAETGNRFNIELVEGEEGMEALRRKLFSSTGVPPRNQILLCGGPPYKPLRASLPQRVLVPAQAEIASSSSPREEAADSPQPALSYTDMGTDTNITDGVVKKNRVYLFDSRTLAPERSVPSASEGGGALGSSTLVPGGMGVPATSSSMAVAAEAEATVTEQEAAEVSEFVGPVEVELPSEAVPALSPPSAQGSGLLKTIANCGRYSLSALNRGEAYLEASCQRRRGGEECIKRMGTQIDALEAAVSNSLDHWEPLQRGHVTLMEKLEEQTLRHDGMLKTFERDLTALGDIPLHPSLAWNPEEDAVVVAAAEEERGERSPLASGPTDAGWEAGATPPSSGGRGRNSQGSISRDPLSLKQQQEAGRRVKLLDCVPVEREHKLLESCRTSQRRFGQEGKAVAQKYATVKRGIEEQRADPVSRDGKVNDLLRQAKKVCEEQESLTAELRKNYSESFQLASKETWADDQEKQDAIRRMTELMATQENIVPTMRDNDLRVRATVVEIARAKAAMSHTLRRRLREVSRLQTDIGKIQKHQELVRMAWGQKEEQFEHLGKVAKMPAAYKAFLREVVRRRRYHQVAEGKIEEFCGAMSVLRSAEMSARESFRETHLGILPPVFVEMAPGLRNMSPVFTPPRVTPLQPGELPEIELVELEDVIETRKEPQSEEQSAPTATAPDVSAIVAVAGVGSVELHVETVQASVGATTAVKEAAAVATQTEEAIPEGGCDKGKSSARDHLNTAQGGNQGGVVEENQPAPEEAMGVENDGAGDRKGKDEAVKATVDREETHPAQEEKGTQSTLLESENARLAAELAEARARLEELEHEARARAAPGVTSAATPAKRAEEACVNLSAGDGDEAMTSPVDAVGARDEQDSTAETEASTMRNAATDVVEGGDVATVLRRRGRSGAKGSSDVTAGGERRRRSVSDEVVGDGRDSAKPASDRRGSGLSREATQKQLIAYRTGLSMLVKLCNQLVAAAATTTTVTTGGERGDGGGGATRADAGISQVASTGPRRAPEGTRPGSPPEKSRSAEPPLMVTNDEPQADAATTTGPTDVSAVAKSEGVSEDAAAAARRPQGLVSGDTDTDADNSKVAVEGRRDDGESEKTENTQTEATEEVESPREVAVALAPARSETLGGVKSSTTAADAENISTGLALAVRTGGAARARAEGVGISATAAATPLKTSDDPSPQEASPVETTLVDGTSGADEGARAGPREAAVVRSASRGVDKIKRAAEHVAAHIRLSHSRVEELLAFEAMASVPRISMCSFSVQDIALFLPTMVSTPEGSGGTVFLAFHVNCPNRYLSEESIGIARQGLGSSPAFILGRIIMIEQHVATEELNPYNVASNTVYYVLTAENLC